MTPYGPVYGTDERLAMLEVEVKQIRSDVCAIDEKVDSLTALVTDAMQNKADKSEVKELRDQAMKVVVGVAAFALTTLVGLSIWIAQLYISRL